MISDTDRFDGLRLHLGNLARLSHAQTRSVSGKNLSGDKGKGGMATEGTGARLSLELGQGWKVSPSIKIAAATTVTLADIAGSESLQHIWLIVTPNYPEALTTIPFFLYFRNTMTILIPMVVGAVLTSALAAYGFSRLRWPDRDLVFNVLLTRLILAYAVTLIPPFLLWAKLELIDTFWPLIVPYWFGGGIFSIFLLSQFFRTIPKELDEAALISRATPLQIFWNIIVLLPRPALIVVAIFAALVSWNDFLGPLTTSTICITSRWRWGQLNSPDKGQL